MLSVAGEGLLPALVLIMVGSVVLGMGLPSAVCYLLMAILIGPVISQLGVPPLSIHFFIFYFGMMSMVTPPVALAAYTTAGIANTPIIPVALTAFRFALAGFALPYFFVFRPELLLILDGGRGVPGAVVAFLLGTAVVIALSAGIVGWLFGPLSAGIPEPGFGGGGAPPVAAGPRRTVRPREFPRTRGPGGTPPLHAPGDASGRCGELTGRTDVRSRPSPSLGSVAGNGIDHPDPRAPIPPA